MANSLLIILLHLEVYAKTILYPLTCLFFVLRNYLLIFNRKS